MLMYSTIPAQLHVWWTSRVEEHPLETLLVIVIASKKIGRGDERDTGISVPLFQTREGENSRSGDLRVIEVSLTSGLRIDITLFVNWSCLAATSHAQKSLFRTLLRHETIDSSLHWTIYR